MTSKTGTKKDTSKARAAIRRIRTIGPEEAEVMAECDAIDARLYLASLTR